MDDYSENSDWDVIYSAFHNPPGIAARIVHALDNQTRPMLFFGFPEVASLLAVACERVFVDSSPDVISRSRRQYPNLMCLEPDDVVNTLRTNDSGNVVISGRLSAFWQREASLEKLANSLLTHPRKEVLIDFFDRDAVVKGQKIEFESNAGSGVWMFEAFDRVASGEFTLDLATLDIQYSVGATAFSYQATRAFFNRGVIQSWCERRFNDYSVKFLDGLLENDPSFTIKLTHQKSEKSVV